LLLRNRELPSEAREAVLQMRSDVRHLMRLILNVLDVSKGEEAALRPERSRLELGTVVARVFESLDMAAREAAVSLNAEVDEVSVSADSDLLERVLENLVENALRHAPPRSQISVVAQAAPEHVEIRVRDRGRGVPEPILATLFEPFVQASADADGAALARTGRGLGLAFCKVAVEAHGGEIWVENEAPGASFCLRLPHA
jgi:signal transduction histidine kinase